MPLPIESRSTKSQVQQNIEISCELYNPIVQFHGI